MRYLGIAVLYVLGLVLQSTLFNFLKVGGVKPDLVLLLVIYFAFTNGPVKGALLGLGLGLLEDFFIGYYFGMNALALLVSGFVAGWFETVMYKENIFIALFVTFFRLFDCPNSDDILWNYSRPRLATSRQLEYCA
ncbi:MAG TPA: rod shape-determining protein MreD [Desulfobacteria bacterium]|nr:rod shape-determining protein MreD [Desulfobacteria bacterium]